MDNTKIPQLQLQGVNLISYEEHHSIISDASENVIHDGQGSIRSIITYDEQGSSNHQWESNKDLDNKSQSHQSGNLDYSNDFESIFSDDTSQQLDPEEKVASNNGEQIVDTIIEAFTVRKRKTFIDHENDNKDLVSYETSEQRIMVFAIGLAIVLSLSATILLAIQFPNWLVSTNVMVIEPKIPKVSFGKSSPHIVLLFRNGNIESFKPLRNWTLERSWTFKVPHSQNESGHFIYSEFNQLFIFYSDGIRDITLVNTNELKNSTRSHYKIPRSKLSPPNFFYSPRFVQVGHRFWIFGGKSEMLSRHDLNEEWKLIDDTLRPSKTLIWHTKRQIYHPGPKLPTKLVGKGYPISLNQTHVAILHLKADWICVEGHVYSFQSFTWTFLECIYEISHTLKSHESFALEATSYFSKNSELQILIKVNFHGWSTSLDSLEMILIDGKTFSSSKLELGLVCNHNQIGLLSQPKYPNKATMVSIQSNIYFIYSHCTDEENMNALDVYTLNGSQLQCLQRIRVNSSSALDWRWITNDFYAISTLF